MQQRSSLLNGAPTLLFALVALAACAQAIPAPQRQVALGVPVESNTVFVGRVEGEFGREMRAAVFAELGKSQRYRVTDAEEAADFVLSGGIHFKNFQTETRPEAWAILVSRSSGTRVWQYTYLDQRTGNELFVPPPQQQLKIVARLVVAELLRATTSRSANANGSF